MGTRIYNDNIKPQFRSKANLTSIGRKRLPLFHPSAYTGAPKDAASFLGDG